VPTETLPAAVALNGISYNIARSFDLRSRHCGRRRGAGRGLCRECPALSAAAGGAVSLEPVSEPSRLPRERLNRAMVSGVR